MTKFTVIIAILSAFVTGVFTGWFVQLYKASKKENNFLDGFDKLRCMKSCKDRKLPSKFLNNQLERVGLNTIYRLISSSDKKANDVIEIINNRIARRLQKEKEVAEREAKQPKAVTGDVVDTTDNPGKEETQYFGDDRDKNMDMFDPEEEKEYEEDAQRAEEEESRG